MIFIPHHFMIFILHRLIISHFSSLRSPARDAGGAAARARGGAARQGGEEVGQAQKERSGRRAAGEKSARTRAGEESGRKSARKSGRVQRAERGVQVALQRARRGRRRGALHRRPQGSRRLIVKLKCCFFLRVVSTRV